MQVIFLFFLFLIDYFWFYTRFLFIKRPNKDPFVCNILASRATRPYFKPLQGAIGLSKSKRFKGLCGGVCWVPPHRFAKCETFEA